MSRAAHVGWAAFYLAAAVLSVATFRMFPDLVVIPMCVGLGAHHAWSAWEAA